jgi:hypothetical protein
VGDIDAVLQHAFDDALRSIAGHVVVDAATRQNDLRVVAQFFGFVREVIGIHTNAVTAHHAWAEWQKVPFAACGLKNFQRVDANAKLHTKVPLHFIGQENSPAVKLEGAIISHILNELEVSCLPKDLPSFLEVDLSGLGLAHPVHVSNIKLPAGVSLVLHGQGDPVVATASKAGGAEPVADTNSQTAAPAAAPAKS